MSRSRATLLQGTLDLLILKALATGELHGLGVSRRVEQMTQGTFVVQPGSLFPALHRLEEAGWLTSKWEASENNRRAQVPHAHPGGTKAAGRGNSAVEPHRARHGQRARNVNTDDTDDADEATRPCSVTWIAMPILARLSSLWRNLVHRDRVDRDLDDELAAVFALLVDEKIRGGSTRSRRGGRRGSSLAAWIAVKQQRSRGALRRARRNAGQGRPIRLPDGARQSRLHLHRRVVAGRRNRRQQRHLFGGECGDVAVAAGELSRAASHRSNPIASAR